MRNAWMILIAFVAGGFLAWFLLRGDAPQSEYLDEAQPTYEEELENHPHLLVKTGVLVVRAGAPDGTVPFGTEVGYRYRDRTSLYNAGEDGMRQLADAPVGDLVVMARAPGYQPATQPRTLLAGVPLEVRLTLVPEE